MFTNISFDFPSHYNYWVLPIKRKKSSLLFFMRLVYLTCIVCSREFFFPKKVHDVKISIISKGCCFILKFPFFILFETETAYWCSSCLGPLPESSRISKDNGIVFGLIRCKVYFYISTSSKNKKQENQDVQSFWVKYHFVNYLPFICFWIFPKGCLGLKKLKDIKYARNV